MSNRTLIVRFPAVVCILLILFVGHGLGQETKLKWFGHAAFSITTPGGKVLLIDPWLANPVNPEAKDNIMGIGGEIRVADGEVMVAMTPAVHSSSVFNPPGITQDATGFASELKTRKVPFREMKPGETLTFQGSRIK